jgi:hypothetical protein
MNVQKLFFTTAAVMLVTGLSASANEVVGKVCSPFVPSNWRAITPVPQGWSATECERLSRDLGATQFQLACFTNGGFVLGAVTNVGSAPIPPTVNCGW